MSESAKSFESMHERCQPALLRYALRRVGPNAAADIVADTFLIAWQKRDTLPDDPTLWLFGVARNVIRSRYRQQQKWRVAPNGDAGEQVSTGDEGDDVAGRHDLRRALANLSFDDAEVLRLFAWEGLSASDVGQVLHCSAPTARVRLFRARKRLSELLEIVESPEPTAPSISHPEIKMTDTPASLTEPQHSHPIARKDRVSR